MNGMIQGGWEYVWATYAITSTALVLYGASLALRLRKVSCPGSRAQSPEPTSARSSR